VRRWIEAQTFSPRLGTSGVLLLDARAAMYADVDEIRIVGLTEADWPERTPRSIFYPQSLLGQLGWPGEQDRFAAARAQFHDLLRLPRRRVSLSSFTLEDDAIVSPSPLLEEVDGAALPIERLVVPPGPPPRVFLHEALSMEPVDARWLDPAAAEWLALRASRTFTDVRFRGTTGPRDAAVYAVSRMERYLECPFKYFAANVLKLPEEKDEQAWADAAGARTASCTKSFGGHSSVVAKRAAAARITTENLAQAMALFDEGGGNGTSPRCPKGIAPSSGTSCSARAAAAGFGERAFTFEIRGTGSRSASGCSSTSSKGNSPSPAPGMTRRIRAALEGRSHRPARGRQPADRGLQDRPRAPTASVSLQLPIYGVCAQQALGRAARPLVDGLARRLHRVQGEAGVHAAAEPEKALSEGQSRHARGRRRHRARRVSPCSRTSRSCATGAPTRASAARTTWETTAPMSKQIP
jgi:hypothetical protein